MGFLTELRARLDALAAHAALDVDPEVLPARVAELDDAAVLRVLADAAAVANGVERLRVVAAGVAARRSSREHGHGGLAAARGHRSPTALVQSIAGGTRADAERQVRLGVALLESAVPALRPGVLAGGEGAGGEAAGGEGAGGEGAGGAAVGEGAAADDEAVADFTVPGGGLAGTLAGEGATDGVAGRSATGSTNTGGRAPEVTAGGTADAVAGPETSGTNTGGTAWGAGPWHGALGRALLGGSLTSAAHDAILRGLGEPPVRDGDDADAVAEAWALAAAQLAAEARGLTAEELSRRARQVRDLLDPEGAEERFARRFENRSFRMWTDADGVHQARIAFDDEMAAWVRSIVDSALRPRRGGPRFMTEEERAAAAALVADPRTNDQLAYDVLTDTLRAGALASAADVFGARQPGVRMVMVADETTHDARGRLRGVGHVEDGGDTVPGTVVDRAACTVGIRRITVDEHGDPLDVGREQRLYTARQRVALAVRDGGCMFPECAMPPSACEAHHADHWWEHHGRTDVGRGILLCRFHHMLLHNNGWRISREADGPFVLHPPPGRGGPIVLRSKSPLRGLWAAPPRRVGWRHAPSPPRAAAG